MEKTDIDLVDQIRATQIAACKAIMSKPDVTAREYLQAEENLWWYTGHRVDMAIQWLDEKYPPARRVKIIREGIQERLKLIQEKKEALYGKYADSRRLGAPKDISEPLAFLERVEAQYRADLAGTIKPTYLSTFMGEAEILKAKEIGFPEFLKSPFPLLFSYENETTKAMIKK